MLGISVSNARVGGFRGGVSAEAKTIYNRIIADGGVSNLTRLNFFVKGLKAIYGDLANVPVCYDAHWIGYKLGSGTGATAGQAAAKLYSLTVAGDAVQSTAASQPLLLAHNGASSDNYWYGSGNDNNYCSTPSSVNTQQTGNIEITAYKITYKSAGNQSFVSNRRYSFYITSGNFLAFEDSLASTSYSTVSIGSPFSGAVKVYRTATEIKFYTSTDNINFTQLGSTITISTTILGTANTLYIGTYGLAVGFLTYNNNIGRVTIATSLGGAPVVDFNPATYNAATSQTAWTSATGEIWTISTGTATSGYKGVLVDRTIVQLDRTDDSMSVALSSEMQTTLSANCGFGLAATRFTTTNNEFVATLGGDFTAPNSTQVWLQGGTMGVDLQSSGIARTGITTTGTYTFAKRFSYVDNIIYGGTTIQFLNATTNSGTYFNNTTNKPTITSGNLVLGQSGFGRLNGNLFTFILTKDGTKYAELQTLIRSLNNNFAL